MRGFGLYLCWVDTSKINGSVSPAKANQAFSFVVGLLWFMAIRQRHISKIKDKREPSSRLEPAPVWAVAV